MNHSTPFGSFKFLVAGWLAAALLVAGCSEPQSSSSTNWLRCQSDADCAAVTGAVCRSDAICVDATGSPIPASAVGSGASAGGGQGGAAVGGDSAGGASSENAAGATAAGAPANMAGSSGVDACPAGPPAADSACSSEGLVCDYAGSSVGITATCEGGVWVHQSGAADPTYVCPGTLPEQGASCPKPPTPAYSALVCLYDCAGNDCQMQGGAGCGAFQANCEEDAASGEWHWTTTIRISCTI
jgi:hypothetical protein